MNQPSKIESFRDLKVWQKGISLVEHVYLFTRDFPKEETYGLTSQMRRAAVSVPGNIAEGHARESTKEFLRFLSIAVGSLSEVETYLEVAKRLTYGKAETADKLLTELTEERRMLRGLQRSLKAKLPPPPTS